MSKKALKLGAASILALGAGAAVVSKKKKRMNRGRKLKTFLDKKQDLLIVDTDETGIFCVRGRKIDDIEENPFAVAVLTTATMITVLIVGIRSRSGKRGDSHKGEK